MRQMDNSSKVLEILISIIGIEELTIGAVFIIGFPVEAELLVQISSTGGGNTLPERLCRVLALPVIC